MRSIARSGVCLQRRPHAQQQLARDLEVELEVGGEDGADEEAEDAHVQPALDQTESLHRRMGRPAGLLLELVTAPA